MNPQAATAEGFVSRVEQAGDAPLKQLICFSHAERHLSFCHPIIPQLGGVIPNPPQSAKLAHNGSKLTHELWNRKHQVASIAHSFCEFPEAFSACGGFGQAY